jgi:hypothetical protein
MAIIIVIFHISPKKIGILNIILLKHYIVIVLRPNTDLILNEVTIMSKIIYLKDILLAKADKKNKKIVGRPKLKPFKHESTLKSSLIEKKTEDGKQSR